MTFCWGSTWDVFGPLFTSKKTKAHGLGKTSQIPSSNWQSGGVIFAVLFQVEVAFLLFLGPLRVKEASGTGFLVISDQSYCNLFVVPNLFNFAIIVNYR